MNVGSKRSHVCKAIPFHGKFSLHGLPMGPKQIRPMEIHFKSFQELTNDELYQALRLRSAVFVVEQDCVYQDMDNKDQRAIHLLAMEKDRVLAYTRIFRPGDYFDNASIGRVVVEGSQRMHGFGKQIMLASLAWIRELYPDSGIEISAQSYLVPFYMGLGFKGVGTEYLEDGIPHCRMVIKN